MLLSFITFLVQATARSCFFCTYIHYFQCHASKKEIGNRPVEEANKMKCYKRLIYKQFVQVFVVHSF